LDENFNFIYDTLQNSKSLSTEDLDQLTDALIRLGADLKTRVK
jgi:hypothetical protein